MPFGLSLWASLCLILFNEALPRTPVTFVLLIFCSFFALLNPKNIHDVIKFNKWRCVGKPEMERTSARTIAPTRPV